MQKIISFFDEVRQEVKKISWANKKETKYSIMIILVCVTLFSLIFLALDMAIYNVIHFILNLGVS